MCNFSSPECFRDDTGYCMNDEHGVCPTKEQEDQKDLEFEINQKIKE